MSAERHSTDGARRVKMIPSGLPPGWIIPFADVHACLGLRKDAVASWKWDEKKNPDGIVVHRDSTGTRAKEFVFTDDVIEFLARRWKREK